MIDTIKITIISKDIGNIPDLIYSSTLNNERAKSPNALIKHANLKNIRIKCKEVNEGYFITVQGSLQKYYLDNNLNDFTFDEIKSALNLLSEDLGIDLMQGVVKRIDFGVNVFVKHTPRLYNIHLIEAKRYKKDTYNNFETVVFRKGRIALSFYDKIVELKKKYKKAFTSHLNGKKIIRYEVRILKELTTALGLDQSKLLVADLYSKKVYKRIVRLWYKEYRLIYKSSLVLSMKNIRNFKDYLCLKAINSLGGFNHAMVVLDEWCKLNDISRQRKSSIKKQLKVIQHSAIDRKYIISELNKKIKRTKNNILSSI